MLETKYYICSTVGAQVSKCYEGLQCEQSSGVCCCNRIHSNFNMAASVEDILDEILMSDNDSESEQLVESTGLQRVTDMEEKLEAQIKTCLEAFDELDLGNNVNIFKESVCKQIEGSFQAFKPPTDPLKILLNVSLNCGSLYKTESKFWLQKINDRLTGKPSIKTLYKCEIQQNIPVELFHCLQRALQCLRIKNITDNVTYEDGKNHSAMSFVSKEAVVVFLSQLSGLGESDIKKYFKKYLSGRVNGKATVIVNTGKKCEFINKQIFTIVHFFSIMEYGTRQDFLFTIENSHKLQWKAPIFGL